MHQQLNQDQLYVTVDLLILSVRSGRLTLMLSKRQTPPYATRWALPGRFVSLDESAETAARNLTAEMFPVARPFLEQLYTFTEVNRDPRGRVISTAYLMIVPEKQLEAAMNSAPGILKPFRVMPEREPLRLEGEGVALVGSDLAFDHGRIIETGISRLQGKIDYTDIAFRFLNDRSAFSLSEVQQVFEAVLAHPLDASNFRRFIRNRWGDTGRIRPIEKEEAGRRGRPAALYRWDEK